MRRGCPMGAKDGNERTREEIAEIVRVRCLLMLTIVADSVLIFFWALAGSLIKKHVIPLIEHSIGDIALLDKFQWASGAGTFALLVLFMVKDLLRAFTLMVKDLLRACVGIKYLIVELLEKKSIRERVETRNSYQAVQGTCNTHNGIADKNKLVQDIPKEVANHRKSNPDPQKENRF